MNINNISKRIDPMNQPPLAFWSLPAAELLAQLQATPQGITADEARQRLQKPHYSHTSLCCRIVIFPA